MESVETIIGPRRPEEGRGERVYFPQQRVAMQELEQMVLELTASCSNLEKYKLISGEIDAFIAANDVLLPKQYVREVYYQRLDHVGYSIDFFRLYERLLGTPRENIAGLRSRSDRLEKYIQANRQYLPPELLEKYKPLEVIADIRKVLPKPEPPKKRVFAGFIRRRPKRT